MSEETNPAAGAQAVTGWRRFLPSKKAADESSSVDSVEELKDEAPIEKWSLGILNDKETEEVPGEWQSTCFRGRNLISAC
jgi:hypothetical protein